MEVRCPKCGVDMMKAKHTPTCPTLKLRTPSPTPSPSGPLHDPLTGIPEATEYDFDNAPTLPAPLDTPKKEP